VYGGIPPIEFTFTDPEQALPHKALLLVRIVTGEATCIMVIAFFPVQPPDPLVPVTLYVPGELTTIDSVFADEPDQV